MRYVFSDIQVDPVQAELRRGDAPVHLEPQVFALLLYLLENRHRVVSKEELRETIWANKVVSDSALDSRIKSVRQAIGDSGREQRLISTLHRVGYRFIADVDVIASAPAPFFTNTASPGLTRRVAVLPPVTHGASREEALLAEGLAHDIIVALGRSRLLSVIARGSAFLFRDAQQDALLAAQTLGADYVLSGALGVEQGAVQLQVSLVEGANGTLVWGESFDTPMGRLAEVERELAAAVASACTREIYADARRNALLGGAESLDSWSAYHRGLWHMYRFQAEHLDRATECFEHAVALSPGAAAPQVGLSFVHWQRAYLHLSDDVGQAQRCARQHAELALDLDPEDPEAHWALGRVLVLEDDFESSLTALQTAVALNSSNVMSLYSLARSHTILGQPADSIALLESARGLSPFDPMGFAIDALQAFNEGDLGNHQQATELIDRAVRQPNAHYHVLGFAAYCHYRAGQRAEAAGYYRRLLETSPDYAVDDFIAARPLYLEGDISEARSVFAELARL